MEKEEKSEVNTVGLYSEYFNQIDVIFTDMEDYFCQAKERILSDIRKTLQSNKSFEGCKRKSQEKI